MHRTIRSIVKRNETLWILVSKQQVCMHLYPWCSWSCIVWRRQILIVHAYWQAVRYLGRVIVSRRPDSHVKRESLVVLELVLIGPGIFGGDNWLQVSCRLRVWLQCHFHDFLSNRTLVRTYLITHWLADCATPTQYVRTTRLSPVFRVRVWLRKTTCVSTKSSCQSKSCIMSYLRCAAHA